MGKHIYTTLETEPEHASSPFLFLLPIAIFVGTFHFPFLSPSVACSPFSSSRRQENKSTSIANRKLGQTMYGFFLLLRGSNFRMVFWKGNGGTLTNIFSGQDSTFLEATDNWRLGSCEEGGKKKLVWDEGKRGNENESPKFLEQGFFRSSALRGRGKRNFTVPKVNSFLWQAKPMKLPRRKKGKVGWQPNPTAATTLSRRQKSNYLETEKSGKSFFLPSSF